MNPEHQERLKKAVKLAVPSVLGAVAVKNIRDKSQVNHISYWEASQVFIMDIIKDGQERATRLSGRLIHGPAGKEEIEDIELYEGFTYSDSEVQALEEASATFPKRLE